MARQPPKGPRPPQCWVFEIHTQINHTRLDSGRLINPTQKPLPDNTKQSKQTSMSPATFEPATPTSERPQTDAVDRAATGIGVFLWSIRWNYRTQTCHVCTSCEKFVLLQWKYTLQTGVGKSRFTVVRVEKDTQVMIITKALLTQMTVTVAQCT